MWPLQPNPHIRFGGHVPQSSACPQPSSAVPHWYPYSAQVFGAQASASGPASPPELLDDELLLVAPLEELFPVELLLVDAAVVELVDVPGPELEDAVVEDPPVPEPEEVRVSTVLPQAATVTTAAVRTARSGRRAPFVTRPIVPCRRPRRAWLLSSAVRALLGR
jgi:hypothetical protein